MKLTFIGADHEVTGSMHCLEACGKKILIDYGMEQGRNPYVNQAPPFEPAQADFVLVTHTHIDHIGLLPTLVQAGFRGQVLATCASCELAGIMLRDSAHIQESDAEWKTRKALRSGGEPVTPLYTLDDAERIMKRFLPCHYGETIPLCEGISVRFVDAGHLLGSASIEVWIEEAGVRKKLVFSGDIGNTDQPLINDPTYLTEADYVIMECTYGDRTHAPVSSTYEADLEAILARTLARGGNVVIPCFAVGRTQEMLYFLRKLKADTQNPLIRDVQVYLDSPLAIEATHIFGQATEECFDKDTLALIRQGISPIDFPGLHTTVTSTESQALNLDKTPKVILSASGMCDAGRIRHHLKHNLWRPECTIVFAGYQAAGTLGRILQDGAVTVKLFGEEVAVNAEITQLNGVSGHADQNGLIRWVTAFERKPEKVFLVHGDDAVCDSFAALLAQQYHLPAEAPFSGAQFDLAAGVWLRPGVQEFAAKTVKTARTNAFFQRLVAAGKRLVAIIAGYEGHANKELAKFTDQINALCDKWEE